MFELMAVTFELMAVMLITVGECVYIHAGHMQRPLWSCWTLVAGSLVIGSSPRALLGMACSRTSPSASCR